MALPRYELALAIQPDSVDARYNFALALKAAGYALDAADEFKKILAANPDEVRAHLALANLCAQSLHDPAQARQHYLKVLELAAGQSAGRRHPLLAFGQCQVGEETSNIQHRTTNTQCGGRAEAFVALSRNLVTFCGDFFMRKPGNQESWGWIHGFLVSLLNRFWLRLGRAMDVGCFIMLEDRSPSRELAASILKCRAPI